MPGELLRAMAITDSPSTLAADAGTAKPDLNLYLIVSLLHNPSHELLADDILVE